MSSDPVLVDCEDGVATVTFNRPDKMNALDTGLLSILPGVLEELARDRDVRCVLLTGTGDRAFSAGGDITEMVDAGPAGARSSGEPMETAVAGLRQAMESSALLHEMPKPTLAAVNGACAGAALALALACDMRIAARHAVFVTAFARIGYSGDFGGSYYMTKIVGTAKARELYFLSDRIDADEALRVGLVNRVVPGEKLRDEANALARRIADGPPLAYRYMKRNLNLAVTGQHRELLDREAEAMVRTGMTEDFGNAARAFLQKKTPTFRGR